MSDDRPLRRGGSVRPRRGLDQDDAAVRPGRGAAPAPSRVEGSTTADDHSAFRRPAGAAASSAAPRPGGEAVGGPGPAQPVVDRTGWEQAAGHDQATTGHDQATTGHDQAAAGRTRGHSVTEDAVLPSAWADGSTPPASARRAAAPTRRPGPWAWGVAVLVVALVVGGVSWWRASMGSDAPVVATAGSAGTPAAGSADATGAGSTAPTTSSVGASAVSAAPSPSLAGTSPSATPRPSALPIEVTGPGTVDAVRAHLVGAGFTCEQEERPGMASWLCTRYRGAVSMFAYVGGANGHRLGRVSLDVQDGNGPAHPEALALQQWLVGRAVAATDVPKVLSLVRKGTDQAWAETTAGAVHARGAGDGSVVLYVDGWLPTDAFPADLLPSKSLPQGLVDLGYQCDTADRVTSCTRTTGGVQEAVEYHTRDLDVTYLKVKTTGSDGLQQAARDQVRSVVGLFQEHAAMQSWLDRHAKDTAGATGFADDLMLDWYPGTSMPGRQTAVFYVRQSCWTDTVENC